MGSRVVVVHGGRWKDNVYEGGIKDYIPLPPRGLSYNDLLCKLEVRLKKPKEENVFDIDAIINSSAGEVVRIKVTDDMEWQFLMEMTNSPTLFVNSISNVNTPGSNVNNVSDRMMSMIVHPNLGGSISCTSSNECGSSAWKFGSSSQVEDVHDPLHLGEDVDREILACGSLFPSKDSLISAVHAYHLKNNCHFKTIRSTTRLIRLACKYSACCQFSLRAKALGSSWRIYVWVIHTCEKDIRSALEPNVSSRAVAEHILPSIAEDGFVLRPCDIQGQFLREFGMKLKYPTALAAKIRALKSLYGDPDKSFQIVGKYLYMLQLMNPGSVVDLQTLDDSSFQYCFFCLYASIRAFSACKPVIVVDATHLKGKFRGVLFAATTKDANEQIVPLAFGVGDKETDSSWTWFLQHIRQCFGTPDNLLIVSDQHKSIKNSVESVYPGTPHGFCTYHIQGNLRGCGDDVIALFNSAARAYKEAEFQEHMDNLYKTSPGAYSKLMALDPSTWASCRCPVRRYGFGTSNAVESLNGRLKWARKLPITSLLEYVRNLIQSWFYKRRTKAQVRVHELSEYAEKRLVFAMNKSNSYRVEPISDTKFNIIAGPKMYTVDLGKRECSCCVFQADLFPCSHAIAGIRYKRETPLAYVHHFYSSQTWRDIYAAEVMPVPHPSDWNIPSSIEDIVLLTPANPRQAGRPKMNKIPKEGIPLKPVEAVEGGVSKTAMNKRKRSCSRCHKEGHYANTCAIVVQSNHEVVDVAVESVVKRYRKPKKCSICGVEGHTRTTCKNINLLVL